MSALGPTKKKIQEKLQPIEVYLRIRPPESPSSKSCIDYVTNKEISIVGHSKRYQFEQIFDENASQLSVYKRIVGRFIPDVRKGYNCTVFAYGQTGTGKTYTFVGDKLQDVPQSWREDSGLGCIIRSALQVFESLNELDPNVKHTVTVSFMEIYNEEIRDLLADKENVGLKIYEGKKKQIYVKDLLEITVCSVEDVFSLLQKGCERRQVASTNINNRSSRSHTVFTFNVSTIQNLHMAEAIACGKLNLVDLAGSENIAKSGATDVRARESTSINKSLLILGRVIKALEENSPHVPYRDSKLTRILQDSLGGTTKTSIIATITKASSCVEETINTLERISAAKRISNCPQLNIKTAGELTDLNAELARLRKDLMATSQNSGIYMDNDNYDSMIKSIESYKKEIMDKHLQLGQLQEELETAHGERQKYIKLNESFIKTQLALEQTGTLVKKQQGTISKQTFLADVFQEESKNLYNLASNVVKDQQILHGKMSRLYEHSSKTHSLVDQNARECQSYASKIRKQLEDSSDNLKTQLIKITNYLEKHNEQRNGQVLETTNDLQKLSVELGDIEKTALNINREKFIQMFAELSSYNELFSSSMNKLNKLRIYSADSALDDIQKSISRVKNEQEANCEQFEQVKDLNQRLFHKIAHHFTQAVDTWNYKQENTKHKIGVLLDEMRVQRNDVFNVIRHNLFENFGDVETFVLQSIEDQKRVCTTCDNTSILVEHHRAKLAQQRALNQKTLTETRNELELKNDVYKNKILTFIQNGKKFINATFEQTQTFTKRICLFAWDISSKLTRKVSLMEKLVVDDANSVKHICDSNKALTDTVETSFSGLASTVDELDQQITAFRESFEPVLHEGNTPILGDETVRGIESFRHRQSLLRRLNEIEPSTPNLKRFKRELFAGQEQVDGSIKESSEEEVP